MKKARRNGKETQQFEVGAKKSLVKLELYDKDSWLFCKWCERETFGK